MATKSTQTTQKKGEKSLGSIEDLTVERKELIAMDLNSLLMLETDALGLYDEVASFFEDDEEKVSKIEAFRGDHERHVKTLTGLIESLGAEPVPTDQPSPFGEHAVAHFNEAAEDEGTAMLLYKVAEHAVKDRYTALLEEPLPDEVREAIEKCAEDEDKHYKWAKEQCEEMDVPGRDPE